MLMMELKLGGKEKTNILTCECRISNLFSDFTVVLPRVSAEAIKEMEAWGKFLPALVGDYLMHHIHINSSLNGVCTRQKPYSIFIQCILSSEFLSFIGTVVKTCVFMCHMIFIFLTVQ